jgi:hypothetical protein
MPGSGQIHGRKPVRIRPPERTNPIAFAGSRVENVQSPAIGVYLEPQAGQATHRNPRLRRCPLFQVRTDIGIGSNGSRSDTPCRAS